MVDTKLKYERLITLEQLVERMSVKKSWVYDMTSRKKIPHRRIAGKLMFDPVELDVWIDQQPGSSVKSEYGDLARRQRKE